MKQRTPPKKFADKFKNPKDAKTIFQILLRHGYEVCEEHGHVYKYYADCGRCIKNQKEVKENGTRNIYDEKRTYFF